MRAHASLGACRVASWIALLGAFSGGCSAASSQAQARYSDETHLPEFARVEQNGGAAPQQTPSASQLDSSASTSQAPAELWCASGGAPLVGQPVLDQRERVYVATSDGYLHAFERDGRFRFSYTVKGTPLGRVSLRADDGVVLIGTSASLIYAINQSGTLHWSFRTVAPVWSGLFPLNRDSVAFMGLDHRLYVLSNTGGALYRVKAPSAPTTEPEIAGGDVVWVGLSDGVARFQAAYKLERIPLGTTQPTSVSSGEHGRGSAPSPAAELDAPVEQVVAVGKAAIARKSLHAFWLEQGRAPRDLGRAEQLGADGQRAALLVDGQLRVLGSAGQVVAQTSGLEQSSGELGLWGSEVWIPHADGSVSIWDSGDDSLRKVQISAASISGLTIGQSGKFAVASDMSGQFCAFTIQ